MALTPSWSVVPVGRCQVPARQVPAGTGTVPVACPAYVPEDDKTLERALKWHIIQHEALLRMSNDRGGHTARRRQVGAQLHLWETGGQRALIEQLLVDRRDAKRDLLQRAEEQVRPQIAGGRADTARMQDMAALNRLRDAKPRTETHAIRREIPRQIRDA